MIAPELRSWPEYDRPAETPVVTGLTGDAWQKLRDALNRAQAQYEAALERGIPLEIEQARAKWADAEETAAALFQSDQRP